MADFADKIEAVAALWIQLADQSGNTLDWAINEACAGMSQNSPVAGLIKAKISIEKIKRMQAA